MGDDDGLNRREYLQSSSFLAALGGCLGGPPDRSPSTDVTADGPGRTRPTETENGTTPGVVDVETVRTDHLLTDSRNAGAVVWKDEDGTVHADAEEEVVESGPDFSRVVQAVVDHGVSKLVIQAGHYVASEPIELDSDTVVTGMGRGTTIEVAGSAAFNVQGNRTGSASVTSRVGNEVIPVDDTGPFEIGEHVLINTNRTTTYRNQPYGEIHKLLDVDEENGQIRISAGGLFDTYRPENGAAAIGLDLVEGVTIRDLEIVGRDRSVFRSGVTATYANSLLVSQTKMHNLAHSGVIMSSSVFSTVSDCELYDIGYDGRGVGYGVTLSDAVRNITVRNNVIYDTKNHCTTVGGSGTDGFPRLLTFRGNEYYQDNADVHFGGVIQFQDNRFANGSGGIITGAEETQINGCEFRNLSDDAIKSRGRPDSLIVNSSQFWKIDGMGVNLYSNPTGMNEIGMAANDFDRLSGNIMRFRTPEGDTCEFLGVTENVVQTCGSTAFNISEIGSSSIEDVNFVGNHFEDISNYVVAAGSVSGPIRFLSNSLSEVSGSYAAILGGRPNLIAANDFNRYGNRGLLVRAGGLVTGNSFSRGGNDAILVYQTDDAAVTNNNFSRTGGSDVNLVDAADCMVVQNDIESGIEGDGEANVIRHNFGHPTEESGTYTASGSGGRSFDIPHGLVEAPAVANVWAESADAAGAHYISAKAADSVTVTYESAPPSGSGNLSWGYELSTHSE